MLLCTLDPTKAVSQCQAPKDATNFCLESGQMPDEWKHVKVTPMPKASSPA